MPANKYCRDCHFSRNKYASTGSWECAAPQNAGTAISLVTGEAIQLYTVIGARNEVTACGPIGRWFRSKEEYLRELDAYNTGVRAPKIAIHNLSKVTASDI